MKYKVIVSVNNNTDEYIVDGHIQQIGIGNKTYKVLFINNDPAFFESTFVKIEEIYDAKYLWCSPNLPTENQKNCMEGDIVPLLFLSRFVYHIMLYTDILDLKMQCEAAEKFVKEVNAHFEEVVIVNLQGTKLFKTVVSQLLPNTKFLEI